MAQTLPFVTAIIVVRDEEQYIRNAVMSFLQQQYPSDRMELLIIDGNSQDRTVLFAKQTVAAWESQGHYMRVRYFENPKKNLAAGWNLGIQAAQGEYVVRIDAHAQADENLIPRCIEILQTHSDVACAGGRIAAQPMTDHGKVISYVMSSPFGVGNSKFRYATESGYVDTVAYGVYRKSIFERAGLFNEEFQRNQDNDMHGRIKACGGKFFLDASIVSLYHPRESVKGMMKQGRGNGRWVIIGWRKSERREGLSPRHLIPCAFVLANLFLLLGGIFFRLFWWGLLAMYVIYFVVSIFFGLQKTRRVDELLRWCAYCWLFHISYGIGSLIQLFRFWE